MAGPLSVAFSNGPGGGWVGLFPVGTSGPNGYVDWQWVTGSQTFSAQVSTLTSGTVTFPRAGMGPVPVGTYVYRWVKDGMVIAQSATLTVADSPPTPGLTTLTPSSVVAGAGAVTVHGGGSGFTAASGVQGKGRWRGTQQTLTLTAADLASGGTLSLTVLTPAPGGGTSNAVTVTVVGPTLTVGQTTGAAAGPLSVTFSNGPGGGWVGLFPVGTSGPNGYVDWQWVTGRQTFSAQVASLTSGTVTDRKSVV